MVHTCVALLKYDTNFPASRHNTAKETNRIVGLSPVMDPRRPGMWQIAAFFTVIHT